ncbi:MAG: TolC family protein [Longimicrobiales bacterium]
MRKRLTHVAGILATLALPVAGLGQAQLAPADPTGAPTASQALQTELPWWVLLDDAGLTELLQRAARANGDLAAAVARISQADAVATQSRALLLPTVSLDGQANAGPLEGLGFQFGGIPQGGAATGPLPDRFYTGSANLNLRYRLSGWGAEYRSLRASRLEAMATRGDGDGVALTLVGQVAEAYYDAVATARQVVVLEEQLDVSSKLAELTQLRFERGEATSLDVLQQRQQLATTRANIPPIRAEYRTSVARLEALVGSEPGTESFSFASSLPDVPGEVVPVVEGELLTSGIEGGLDRPDIRGADARLDASDYRAASARWGFLPTVDFSANVGSQFFRSIDTRNQSSWGAGLTVSLPVLDGLDRVGRVREANASRTAARGTAEQLRLQAAFEVASAQSQRLEQQAQLEALQEQLTWSERAFQESRRRYLAGLVGFLDVLNALNGMQQAELGVIRTQRGVLSAWIQLRQSAGGSWTRGIRRQLLEAI